MDIVTLGAALNGSAEYVNSHFKGGSNIQIVDNPDGTQTINASGEVSSEDTVARAEIAAIKDGETLDSFGDVETALEGKADTTDIPTVPITAIQKNGTGITPVSGTVNITVPTQASDINAATATQGSKADTAIQGIKVNSSTVNPDSNKVVSITVPTSAADVSALPDTTKYAAALSLTINSSTYVITGQLKDQDGNNLGTAQTIDLPLESVVVNGSYNSQTKKVVLTLQNGNTIEFSVADLVSGLQTELSANNKLNPAYINYDSTHRAVSDTEKSKWNGKQSALTTEQLAAVNSGMTSEDVEQINTNKNNILTLSDMTNKYNFAETNSGSAAAAVQIPCHVPAGQYYVYIGTLSSTETEGSSRCSFMDSNDSAVSDVNYISRGSDKWQLFTVTANTSTLWIYASNNYNPSYTVTVSNVMIISKEQHDSGLTVYQPYTPSVHELYEMILALQ